MTLTPTIGRIVHYCRSTDEPPVAGIISGFNRDGQAFITTFPAGFAPNQVTASMGGPDGLTPTPGCWNWPPRE